jgi:hypothetical protein
MPNCPKCRGRMALTEDGCMCINCKREYSPEQVALMPGYNAEEMLQHVELFIVLVGAGLISKGLNTVEYCDDGIILSRKGEQF